MNAPRYASMGRALILIGGGGHAAVVADAARQSGWDLLGFVSDGVPDDEARVQQQRVQLAWLGTRDALADILKKSPPNTELFPAVGDSSLRKKWTAFSASHGASVATVVHPTAVIADSASLERGVFVGAQAVVGPRARVKQGAIINTAAVIEHDCDVGAEAHIAPGAVLTGNISIGAGVFVGARAVVIPRRIVGDGAMIAAGAVVTENVEPGVRVAGCPARPMPHAQEAASSA